MMALVTGVFGVFMSYDMFFFFLFYEIAVVPMYILILVWGSTRKEYAAMKLTLYLMAGSGLIIPGILLLYASSGLNTFNMLMLHGAHFTPWVQKVAFILLFLGFGVLAAMWPLHTWSPVGHVAAPTAVSMLHAGVLMKLGSFAILRVAMYPAPRGLPILGQPHGDPGHRRHCLRRLCGPGPDRLEVRHRLFLGVPYGHRGAWACPPAPWTASTAAVFQMFAHGVMTALFFSSVGYIYDRTHTRDIHQLGGFSRIMPVASAFFITAALCGAGVPGIASFWAELLVFVAAVKVFPVAGMLAIAALVVGALFALRVVQSSFFNEPNPKFAAL